MKSLQIPANVLGVSHSPYLGWDPERSHTPFLDLKMTPSDMDEANCLQQMSFFHYKTINNFLPSCTQVTMRIKSVAVVKAFVKWEH